MSLKDDPIAYAVVGCAMRGHTVLGNGFLESAYGDALEIEFQKQGIPFVREAEIRVFYDGRPLATRYRADFLCAEGKTIVEIKAIRRLAGIEWAQTMHYLRATEAESAVLINFGTEKLQYDYFSKAALASKKSTPMSPTAPLTLRLKEEALRPENGNPNPGALAEGFNSSELKSKTPMSPTASLTLRPEDGPLRPENGDPNPGALAEGFNSSELRPITPMSTMASLTLRRDKENPPS